MERRELAFECRFAPNAPAYPSFAYAEVVYRMHRSACAIFCICEI